MATQAVLPFASGSQIYVGYRLQSDQHTVATTPQYYIPVESDQVNFNFDAGRQAIELATGDLFKDYTVVEYQAKGTGALEFPLFPSFGSQLLSYCGLNTTSTAGGLSLPKPITFFIGRGVGEEVYGGSVCKMITITSTASKPVMVKLEFDFTERPTNTESGGVSALNSPTFQTDYVQEVPFLWDGLGPVTWLSGVTATGSGTSAGQPVVNTTINMDSVEVAIAFDLVPFYGNHGVNLPSELIPAGITVSSKIARLFTNIDEYIIYNGSCAGTGPLIFAWTTTCGVTSHTFTLTLPKAFYKKQSFKNPMKGPILEDYDIGTIKTVDPTTGYSPLTSSFT